ncbi:MAG: transcription-repair coupling factor [Bacilli bacterium]|nr:transcription-repair coupling factor [Bacilli bacterium]
MIVSFLNNIFNLSDEEEVIGLTSELKSLYIYQKFKKENKSILFVTSNLNDASKIYNSISKYTDKVCFFPMDDFLTSEAIAISPEFKTTRLETIDTIIKGEKQIVITNLMGYLRYLPEKKKFIDSYINIKINQEYPIKKLEEKLFDIGYRKETTVTMTGEIATRGFVLDVFPTNTDEPIRLEYWSDEIDTIKIFDPNTQRTIKKIDEITIFPNTEKLINNSFKIPYRELPKHTKVTNIKGYMDDSLIIYDNYQDMKNNYESLKEEIKAYNISKELEEDTSYMHDFDKIKEKGIIFETFDNSRKEKSITYQTYQIEPFPKTAKKINERLNFYLKKKKKVIICLDNRYQVNKIIEDLENPSLIYTNENEIYENKVNLIINNLNSGFETEGYIVITCRELFNQKSENSYKTHFRYGTRIKDITKLNIGDYVVHGAHGIGVYKGLHTILKTGIKKDYLTVEYKGGDKLYIPVEKLDLITKYSGKEGAVPKINKLGSKEWEKTKARARKRAEDMAEDLLRLYALRESKKGFAFNVDDKDQIEFEREFNYKETKDQLKVIEEIKKDMQSNKPMDRLLCGDVGYGKTEVAFRAIFKCILSGKQAALLCPTTILSSQHFQNAIDRFKSFPVDIAILNRFVTNSELKETLEKVEKGQIDLLIGTHRLLSDDVKFKDLGLLVIDEEQRFGVKHKEKIKEYKNNVDVLTLSATPIPRTLQMSMAGIRSLSMLETPPAQRYPIQTYVLAENNQIMKDAINKELAREGQVFILYNKVADIASKKREIESLVPEAKIEIAHGRMDKNRLENIMISFQNHEFDILLCTTIIETGIDIPSVNTLIIIDADRFGLSQLYQIRGRIGRSNKVAYCYLMYNNHKVLSEIATKRLKVIKEFTELGSGFAIAMRDLSIRGAGDILGSEQAGFIDTVGIELFMEMLNEEINKLKGIENKKEETVTQPVVDVDTSIDDNYVTDEDLKIEIHKLINTIDSKQKLLEVKQELEDRFGKINEKLEIYMYEEWLEKLVSDLNIKNIRQTKNFIEIPLNKKEANQINGEKLFYELTKIGNMFRFTSRLNNLNIILDTVRLEKHYIYYMVELMQIIKKCKK